jgi:hypothetical protein
VDQVRVLDARRKRRSISRSVSPGFKSFSARRASKSSGSTTSKIQDMPPLAM